MKRINAKRFLSQVRENGSPDKPHVKIVNLGSKLFSKVCRLSGVGQVNGKVCESVMLKIFCKGKRESLFIEKSG